MPCWKKAGYWICGIEKQPEVPQLTPEQIKEIEAKQNSLYEVPFWRGVVNVNAVLLMLIAVFFWGFFH